MKNKIRLIIEGIKDPVSSERKQIKEKMELLIEMTTDLASALGPDEYYRQVGETLEEHIAGIKERYSRKLSKLENNPK